MSYDESKEPDRCLISRGTGHPLNLAGQKFESWFVIRRSGSSKHGKSLWLCRCECGTENLVLGTRLLRGRNKSCGCKRYPVHHMTGTPTIRSWKEIKTRCYNPKRKDWPNYGGKGIKVCDRWKDSFLNFFEDMGERPNGHTLDRLDNNNDYCKENCRWATPKMQALNSSRSIKIEHNGIIDSISGWARRLNIDRKLIRRRMKRGYSVERTLNGL